MNVSKLNFQHDIDIMGIFDQALLDVPEDLLGVLSLDEAFFKELNDLLYIDLGDDIFKNFSNNDILSIEKNFVNFELFFTNDPADLKIFLESNKNIDGNNSLDDIMAKLDQKSELNKRFPVTGFELITNGILNDIDRNKVISDVLQNGAYDKRKSKQINGIEGIDYQEIASRIVEEVHKMVGSKGILLDDEKMISDKMKKLSDIIGKDNIELSDYLIRSGLCGETEIMNYIIDVVKYIVIYMAGLYSFRAFSRLFPNNLVSWVVLQITAFVRGNKIPSVIKYIVIIVLAMTSRYLIEVYNNKDALSARQKSLVFEKKEKEEGLAYEEFKEDFTISSIIKTVDNLNKFLPIKISSLQGSDSSILFQYSNVKKGLILNLDDINITKEDLLIKIGDLYREAGNLNYARQIFIERVIFDINKRNISKDSCSFIEENDKIYNDYNPISEGLFGDDVIDIIEDLGRETINVISDRYSKYVFKNGLSIAFIDSDSEWYKDFIRTLFFINKIKTKYPYFIKGFKFNFVEEFDKKSVLNFDFSKDILLKIGKEYTEETIVNKMFFAYLLANYSVKNVDGDLIKLSLTDAKVLYNYMEDSSLISNVLSKGPKFMPKSIRIDGNIYIKNK